MSHITHRRLFGLMLGMLTALAFSLVQQNINFLVMPGIPFYSPPFGPVANVALGTAVGALLGYVTAWAETAAKGVLVGSLTGSFLVSAATMVSGRTDPTSMTDKAIGLIIIFVPTTAFFALVMILFRWLINREEDAYRESISWKPPSPLQRILPPVAVVLLAGSLGLLSMYNDLARAVTPRMQALIAEGQNAQSPGQLPQALQVEEVHDFLQNARQPYTIQWDKDDGNKFAIPRPNTSPFDQSTVIARFANGYMLVCVYPDPVYEPRCKDFAP